MHSKPNIFIVCTGVGHINRGYESFTIECFNELKSSSKFELFLLKGGGASSGKEIKIACLKRRGKLAKFCFKVTGREAYWFEQATFLMGMLPALIKYKPAVIYYSDFILGTFLWHLRRFFKFKYKLLFSNGAPNGPPFSTMDHVQQLLAVYEKDAVSKGTPPETQTLLPYGFDISNIPPFLSENEQKSLRQKLGLPLDKKIIISIGAINTNHKRMDYVIKEFAMLDPNKYFLVLLGQVDNNSTVVLNLAAELLVQGSYTIQQVDAKDVSAYLSISDYFILASLTEGFGRVLIEAQEYGLLPIVHDYDVVREVLKSYAVYGDLTKDNQLQGLLKQVDKSNLTEEDVWSYAYNNYSWDKLNSQYEQMLTRLF